MIHRKLGNTGIAVSKIALGCMYFGSETPEADAFAMSRRHLHDALSASLAPHDEERHG